MQTITEKFWPAALPRISIDGKRLAFWLFTLTVGFLVLVPLVLLLNSFRGDGRRAVGLLVFVHWPAAASQSPIGC